MDCASKRITQGHRILKPKQVRREIFVYSFPTYLFILARNTTRELQRSKYLLSIIIDLPIENQYFKSYKMESSFGSFSSSCFNIE